MQRYSLFAGVGRLALVFAVAAATSAARAEAASAADSAASASAGSSTLSGVTVEGELVRTAPAVPPLQTPYTVSTVTAAEVRALPDVPTINIQSMLNY
ncbi:MAG TPA: hypothetical protein VGG92_16400, partial [Caulobacteraceae bacterium]